MYVSKAIDFIQWVWKDTFQIEKSKTQIRRDLEQGAVKLNDRKIKVDDIFTIDDENDNCRKSK
jgi:tyrosyl-tRNA synthetase